MNKLNVIISNIFSFILNDLKSIVNYNYEICKLEHKE